MGCSSNVPLNSLTSVIYVANVKKWHSRAVESQAVGGEMCIEILLNMWRTHLSFCESQSSTILGEQSYKNISLFTRKECEAAVKVYFNSTLTS